MKPPLYGLIDALLLSVVPPESLSFPESVS